MVAEEERSGLEKRLRRLGAEKDARREDDLRALRDQLEVGIMTMFKRLSVRW
jgi:hypothetical protein